MASKLLWVDCIAGGVVGVVVLVLSGWLSEWHGVPRGVLVLTGVANAVRTPVCFGLAMAHFESAIAFGLIHLIGEGCFVGGLAAAEWTCREQLMQRA